MKKITKKEIAKASIQLMEFVWFVVFFLCCLWIFGFILVSCIIAWILVLKAFPGNEEMAIRVISVMKSLIIVLKIWVSCLVIWFFYEVFKGLRNVKRKHK